MHSGLVLLLILVGRMCKVVITAPAGSLWTHSPQALKFLSDMEEQLHGLMTQRLEVERSQRRRQLMATHERINLCNSKLWMTDYQDNVREPVNGERIAVATKVMSWENPLLVFRMIWRYTVLIQKLTAIENANAEFELFMAELQSSSFASSALPSTPDHEHTLELLLGLQHAYNLNTTDLMRGKILSVETGVGLSSAHAHEIGRYAARTGRNNEAAVWLKAAASFHEVREDSEEARSSMEQYLRKLGKVYNCQSHHTGTPKLASENLLAQHQRHQWHRLCAGEQFVPESIQARLFCFYERSNAYWVIGPLKVEVLSHDPYLIRIHEFIGDRTIQHLHEASAEGIQVAEVVKDQSALDGYHKSRVTSLAFLHQYSDKLEALETRISLATGLEVGGDPLLSILHDGAEISEPARVASYGFGGGLETHMDSLPESVVDPRSGNRMATFMIYLNDVRLGGWTVFPRLGFAVRPAKGSALFWFNLGRSGKVDERMLHGGCPVLLGDKWISNTWIRSFANFLTRPCALVLKK